jgi:pimeloyl-ACP methyl ester carboxylesterase
MGLPDAVATARAYATIARWLGPWAKHEGVPPGVRQHDDIVDAPGDRRVRVRVYHPPGGKPPRATFMIAPGLHYAGADDPRQDRFCRVLATAGHLVLAPQLSDYTDLLPSPRAIDDFHAVWAARGRWDPLARPPVVFCISFGGLVGTGLAARVAPSGVARLVLFGCYGGFTNTLRYSLTGLYEGRTVPTRDPLNQPVVFNSFFPYLDEPCPHEAEVRAAWREFVMATWGKKEMKDPARWRPIARALADRVPAGPARQLCEHGFGLTDDWATFAAPIIDRGEPGQRLLDALPYLPKVRCPVDIVHARGDDVIPREEAYVLQRGLTASPRVGVHITGLYDHSGGAKPGPRELLAEGQSMVAVLGLLART